MKRKKPLAPWLPGKYGRMTRAQLDAESDQYDAEFAGVRAARVANSKPHPNRGRPPKRASKMAARVLITIPPELLAAADAAAKKHGLTRAALVRQAVLAWLARQARPRRTA